MEVLASDPENAIHVGMDFLFFLIVILSKYSTCRQYLDHSVTEIRAYVRKDKLLPCPEIFLLQYSETKFAWVDITKYNKPGGLKTGIYFLIVSDAGILGCEGHLVGLGTTSTCSPDSNPIYFVGTNSFLRATPTLSPLT